MSSLSSSLPTSQRQKRKRSSTCCSNESQTLRGSDVKIESEWDDGVQNLSQRESNANDSSRTTDASGSSESSSSRAQLPDLPKVTGDICLELYTHKSLRITGASSSKADQFPPDNERLSEVGEVALNLAVTNHLYHRRPIIEANRLPAERCTILSDENYDRWTMHYELQKKLRYVPPVDISAPKEIRALFNAYVGAVYEESGMRAVGSWISRLIDPEMPPVNPDDTGRSSVPPQNNAFRQRRHSKQREIKRQKSEGGGLTTANTPEPTGFAHDLSATEPPPLPASVLPLGPGVYSAAPLNFLSQEQTPTLAAYGPAFRDPTTKFLPKFNERCAKQRLAVEYLAQSHGSSHAPNWIIDCKGKKRRERTLLNTVRARTDTGNTAVNGVHKGRGQGTSKQIAKEEAARQSFHNMGWVY